MPKRDWREDFITGLGVVLGLSILFAIGWSYIELKTTQRVIEHYGAYGDANKTNAEIANLCIGGSDLARMECLTEKIKAREQQAEKSRDLRAQEGMAFWAKWMFWAAFFGTAAALYGLYLLRRTWLETKRTADVAREIGTNQLRPWVLSHGIEFGVCSDFIVDGVGRIDAGFMFRVQWKNSGQSPAVSAQIFTAFRLVPRDADWEAFVPEALPSTAAIAPGMIAFGSAQVIFGEDLARFIAREVDYILYSRIIYTDSIDRKNRRFTEVTYRCQYDGERDLGNGKKNPNIAHRAAGTQNEAT